MKQRRAVPALLFLLLSMLFLSGGDGDGIPEDRTAPVFRLVSPIRGDAYGSFLLIKGSMLTGDGVPGPIEDLKSLRWRLFGTGYSQEMRVKADGSFSRLLPVAEFSSRLILSLTAEDFSGNRSECFISLRPKHIPPPDLASGKRERIRPGPVEKKTEEIKIEELKIEEPRAAEVRNETAVTTEEEPHTEEVKQEAAPEEDVSDTVQPAQTEPAELSLTLDSPSDGDVYGGRFRVSGRAVIPGKDIPGTKVELRLEIYSAGFSDTSEPLSETLSVEDDGSFELIVSTAAFFGPQNILLSLETGSAGKIEKTLRIEEGESDIPSFLAEPGEGSITLSWDDVLLASSYTVYYTTDGSDPDPKTAASFGSNGTRLNLRDLVNGVRYRFLLRTNSEPFAEDLYSSIREAMPLSPDDLRPSVSGEYRQVRVSWTPLKTVERYELWRSSVNGDFVKIEDDLSECVYIDKKVELGKEYRYRVKPAGIPALLSAEAGGVPAAFSEDRTRQLGGLSNELPRRIVIRGDYAYLASGEAGFKIIDIADPESPKIVSALKTGFSEDMLVRGDYVYIADRGGGLRIISILEPRSPELYGSKYSSAAQGIALYKNYAFIADGSEGIKIMDIENPRGPMRVASFSGKDVRKIRVAGSTAFAADASEGLIILDVSDPSGPVEIGRFSGASAVDVFLSDNRAYLSCGEDGIMLLDISKPQDPVLLAAYDTTDAHQIIADGRYLYLADGPGGLRILDISDPKNPLQLEEVRGSSCTALSKDEEYLYAAFSDGLKVLQLLMEGNSYEIASFETGGMAYRAAIEDGRAFLADHEGGVAVIDISALPEDGGYPLSAVIELEYAVDVAVAGDILYVADREQGLRIFELHSTRDELKAVPAGVLPLAGKIRRLCRAGDRLYCATGDSGLVGLNISRPLEPVISAYYDSFPVNDADVTGNFLLLASPRDGFIIAEPESGGELRILGGIPASGSREISTGDGLAFLTTPEGVLIIDISNPSGPRLISKYPSKNVEDTTYLGPYLYISEGVRGLSILDVTEPSAPFLVSSCSSVYAVSAAVENDTAYVADINGMKAVRIVIPRWLRE